MTRNAAREQLKAPDKLTSITMSQSSLSIVFPTAIGSVQSGAVNQNVEPSIFFRDPAHDGVDGVAIGNVKLFNDGCAARIGDAFGSGFQFWNPAAR